MQCREVRELADSFVVRELPADAAGAVREHLERCARCRTDLAMRRDLRGSVRRAFRHARDLEPAADFAGRLRATLYEAARQQPPRRYAAFPGWLALAATVVLAAALGLAIHGRAGTSASAALARAAAGDHRDCALAFRLAEKPIALAEAARRYGAAYRILEEHPPEVVTTTRGQARVLERHACVFAGRRFAHVVLQYRGARVSLLVTTPEEGAQPDRGSGARPSITAAGRIDGTNVVSFRPSHHVAFLAGSVPEADLAALAEAVAGPLSRALAGA